jgi:DNA-binding GntR family transcriptional regulator
VVPLTGIEAQIYDRLWRLILEGALKPGIKLPEEILGQIFAVSRTVTRKVLQIMEQEGGIHLPFNRGAWVATPSPADVPAVFGALNMAMTYVISGLAAPATTISPHHRELIAQHIDTQLAADEAGDPVAADLLGTNFFVLLAAIHGNTVVTELADRMFMRQALIQRLYQRYALPPQCAAVQRKLADAIFVHRTNDAVALFCECRRAYEHSVRPDDTGDEVDLAAILSAPLRQPPSSSAKPPDGKRGK